MNHDRVELFRKKLDRFIISDYHGLESPGLTCYLNSVLQVLFMTEDFRDAVKRSKDPTTIDPHLGEVFAVLQKSMATTHNITKTLGITDVWEQRDAAEYFEKILCLSSSEAAKTFKGELNHKTRCLECKQMKHCRSFFWILPLVVENKRHQSYSVEKGLKEFFKKRKICGDNKMFCDRCDKKQDADLGCEMTQNPKILTLLLKSFSFDYKCGRYVKLHREVDVPLKLNMKTSIYDLYALVNHFGDLTGGHYTAEIKSFETEVWYHFNDNVVKRVRQPLFGSGDKSLRSDTAYLLMYKMRGNPEKNDEGRCQMSRQKEDVTTQREEMKSATERRVVSQTDSSWIQTQGSSRGMLTLEEPTLHSVNGMLEPHRESQKKRGSSIVAKTRKETTNGTALSLTRNGVKCAETKAVKDKIKSNCTKRDEGKIQHERRKNCSSQKEKKHCNKADKLKKEVMK